MYFLTYCKILAQTIKLKPRQKSLCKTYSNLTFLLQKTIKYFNDFPNQIFSVLWLKWTKTMQMKQNQRFFHGFYDVIYFLSKNAKLFQWLSKSQFLSFITKVDLNSRNETKSDNVLWDIIRSGNIFQWSQNTKLFRWLL